MPQAGLRPELRCLLIEPTERRRIRDIRITIRRSLGGAGLFGVRCMVFGGQGVAGMRLVSVHVVEYAIHHEKMVLMDRICSSARLFRVPPGSIGQEEAVQCPIAILNP